MILNQIKELHKLFRHLRPLLYLNISNYKLDLEK
jgi:hypothetical protein